MDKLKYKGSHYQCELEIALDIVSGKWKGLILWNLSNKTLRHSELMRQIPKVTQKMLTQTLRNLEEHKIIKRKVYAVVPPKVEYSLTSQGQSLIPVLEMLCDWGKTSAQELGVKEI